MKIRYSVEHINGKPISEYSQEQLDKIYEQWENDDYDPTETIWYSIEIPDTIDHIIIDKPNAIGDQVMIGINHHSVSISCGNLDTGFINVGGWEKAAITMHVRENGWEKWNRLHGTPIPEKYQIKKS